MDNFGAIFQKKTMGYSLGYFSKIGCFKFKKFVSESTETSYTAYIRNCN